MLQSWDKWLTHFVWFRRKSNPLLPMQCWSELCCHKTCQITQHWLMRTGKDYDEKQESLLSTEQCYAPFFYFSGKHGNSCYNCIRCANYFIADDRKAQLASVFFKLIKETLDQLYSSKCIFHVESRCLI